MTGARGVAGPTRRQLLGQGARGGLAAATLGAAALLAAPVAEADHPGPALDADRLRRLISVELLMLYSYQHVLAGSFLSPGTRTSVAPLRGYEAAHVRALSARLSKLGGTPPRGPSSVRAADRDLARRGVAGRLGQLTGEHDALHLLLDLEKVVVGAYFVALIKLSDPELIVLAAQTMASGAQHEAVLGEALYPGDAQKAVPSGLVQGIQ